MQIVTGDRAGPFGIVAKWWRNWTARDTALREPGCYDHAEAAHIARDVGVQVSEPQTLAGRWPDTPNLLERNEDWNLRSARRRA